MTEAVLLNEAEGGGIRSSVGNCFQAVNVTGVDG
jgi:hypothetical protein